MNATTLMAVELAQLSFDIQASRYLSVAGFVVLIYDHLLTLSDEVRLVWRQPLSLVSTLFLINRYTVPIFVSLDMYDKGGLARNLSNNFCRRWFWMENNLQVVSFAITHALVALRVRALWGNKRWVNRMIFAMGLIYFVATMVLNNAVDLRIMPTLSWFTPLNLCFTTSVPRWTSLTFVPALIFETALVGLTIAKALSDRRRHLSMSALAGILYRDGFLYFLVIASCGVLNIIVWSSLRPSLVALAKYFTFSFVNVMSSRLVLNLRSLRDNPDEDHAVSVTSSFGGAAWYHPTEHTIGGGDMNVQSSSPARLKNKRPSPLRFGFSGGGGDGGGSPSSSTSPYDSSRVRSALKPKRSIRRKSPVDVEVFYGGSGRSSYELYELGATPTATTVRVQVEVDVDVDVDVDHGESFEDEKT